MSTPSTFVYPPFPQEPECQVPTDILISKAVPFKYWDACAHLLIPLNDCRHKYMSLPFKCNDERHAYEKCQYKSYLRRMQRAIDLKEERLKSINTSNDE